MTRLHSPASLMDLASCAGNCSAFKWSALRVQFAEGATWALRTEAGEPIAVAGILRDGGAWFIASPRATFHLPAIVRAIRGTLAGNVPPIVLVEVRTPAGVRIARLCGFVHHAGGLWARRLTLPAGA